MIILRALKKINKNFIIHLLVFAFYFWTASGESLPSGEPIPSLLKFNKHPTSYSHFMADSLINKRLELLITPDKRLLELSNPFDPNLNSQLRLHDASLFNNKYYLYFSPLMSWLFVAPYKILTNRYFSEPLLTVLMCFFGYLIMCKIVEEYACVQQIHFTNQVIFYLTLAAATSVPWLLRRTAIYELCIASGFAFLMAAYFLALKIFFKKEPPLFYTTLLSGFLGCTVFSRPNQIVPVLFIYFIFVYLFIRRKNRYLLQMLALTVPLGLILIIIMVFNYLRYGTVSEFGMSFQLWGHQLIQPPIKPTVMGYIPLGTFHYLFTGIEVIPEFPFVIPQLPSYVPKPLHGRYFTEPLTGILYLPVLIFLFILLFCFKHFLIKNRKASQFVAFLATSGILTLLVLSSMFCVTMRYLVDFLPSLVLASICAYLLMTCEKIRHPIDILKEKILLYTVCIISILVCVCLSFSGYYEGFKTTSPKQYLFLNNLLNLGKIYQNPQGDKK